MSDLRNLLDREAERISAKPGALDGVMRRAERRHRTRRVVAGVTALALVGGVALGAWNLLGNQPREERPGATGWEGIWPHATREQAEDAQAAVDRGDEGLAWQLTFAEVGSRYLQQNHGWTDVRWGEDAERDGARITVYAASCDLGDCKDPGPADGAHQEVLLTLEQLVRPGEGGVWTVTKVVGPSTALVRSQFGLGRIILVQGAVNSGAGFDCPAGPFVAPTEAQTSEAIESFLAASNGVNADPQAVWDMLEPAVRGSLGPYEIFEYHLRSLPAEPYGEWDIDAVDAQDVYNTAPLEETCPGTSAYLSEAYVTFPGDPMQPMPAQFIFIGLPGGPKLWSVRS